VMSFAEYDDAIAAMVLRLLANRTRLVDKRRPKKEIHRLHRWSQIHFFRSCKKRICGNQRNLWLHSVPGEVTALA